MVDVRVERGADGTFQVMIQRRRVVVRENVERLSCRDSWIIDGLTAAEVELLGVTLARRIHTLCEVDPRD